MRSTITGMSKFNSNSNQKETRWHGSNSPSRSKLQNNFGHPKPSRQIKINI